MRSSASLSLQYFSQQALPHTYASVVAALSSLKGPKHGGANIMVVKMFKELERSISDWEDDDEILAYLERILHKDAFDRSGVIYGMGHAIYSISDVA